MNRHWTMETVFEEYGHEWTGDDIIVHVAAEVPMLGDERLTRYGNRYYQTTVKLEGEGWDVQCNPEQARELAALIVKAADAADAIDAPDCAPCGHWAPCDCGQPTGARG